MPLFFGHTHLGSLVQLGAIARAYKGACANSVLASISSGHGLRAYRN